MISVIMPVYNGEPYLNSAIEAILAQTEKNFEFIIFDDGSTDSSLSIIKAYAELDSRIRYFSRENKGLPQTRNDAIAEMRGDVFAWADADDLSMPTRIAELAEFLDQHPEIVAVGSRVELIDSEGMPLMDVIDHFTHEEINAALIAGNGLSIWVGSSMIRKEAALEIGGYRPETKSAEDVDFWLRLAEVGKLANLRSVLAKYRQHTDSIGYTRRNEQIECHKQALIGAYNRRNKKIPDWVHEMGANLKSERPRKAHHHRKWAWWALKGGNIETARKHAKLALRHQPFSIENWRAFSCALRGH